jgi:hypothetical protein
LPAITWSNALTLHPFSIIKSTHYHKEETFQGKGVQVAEKKERCVFGFKCHDAVDEYRMIALVQYRNGRRA